MLVGPGFHAVVAELPEQFVGQNLVTQGAGLVAAGGKISEERRTADEAVTPEEASDGEWADIYARTGSKLAAETF